MGRTLTINNKIYNYLMKHKGPALLDLSKSNQFFKLQFDNFADAKKFKDDGFIPDHLADDINWDGGSDEFDFENTTYWRKN